MAHNPQGDLEAYAQAIIHPTAQATSAGIGY